MKTYREMQCLRKRKEVRKKDKQDNRDRNGCPTILFHK